VRALHVCAWRRATGLCRYQAIEENGGVKERAATNQPGISNIEMANESVAGLGSNGEMKKLIIKQATLPRKMKAS